MFTDFYWGLQSEGQDNNNSNKKRKLGDPECNDTKNYQIYDPLIYTFGKEVHFTADVNALTIEIVIKHISAIVHEYAEDYATRGETLEIVICTDSHGGSCTSILKYVDFIKLVKLKHPHIKFTSVISGIAASAGTIMAIVADKRIITKNAITMIHDIGLGMRGSYTQVMAEIESLEHLNDALVNIYAENSKKSKEELGELLKTNKWFNAQQYLEYGFVDSIV